MDLFVIVITAAVVLVALVVGLTVARIRRRPPLPPEQPVADQPPAIRVIEPHGPQSDALTMPSDAPAVEAEPVPGIELEELTVTERFRRRLTRTRNVLGTSVADLFGRGVSDEAWDGLEEALIGADVGVQATTEIVDELRRRSREQGVTSGDQVVELLKEELRHALGSHDRSLRRAKDGDPSVWLVTGVNGTGKTTTIGKLAAREARDGRQVVVAAADTFRAAAAEQLGLWAARTGARLVRRDEGADPAAVAFDGYNAARATDADVCIIDTAGRLHNKRDLMEELSKVKRVVEKQAGPLQETLLVLDATTGQNGIQQARAFLDAVDITGIALTKLDGSSKGGIVVAVQRELGLPVKLVGLGEDIDDLADFDPDAFVEGLFADVVVA